MTHLNEHMIRNTPEVHDCEWEPELSPWHDVKRFAAIAGLLVFCVTVALYAGREIIEVFS